MIVGEATGYLLQVSLGEETISISLIRNTLLIGLSLLTNVNIAFTLIVIAERGQSL